MYMKKIKFLVNKFDFLKSFPNDKKVNKSNNIF